MRIPTAPPVSKRGRVKLNHRVSDEELYNGDWRLLALDGWQPIGYQLSAERERKISALRDVERMRRWLAEGAERDGFLLGIKDLMRL